MNNQATLDKLLSLKLYGMANAFRNSFESGISAGYTADEMLAHLVDSECEDRYNKRLSRLLKQANFRYKAHIEELDYSAVRNLDKNTILRLSNCEWIRKGENLIITGATGVGKSFVASALGNSACINGFKVIYYNTIKLFGSLKYAKADGSYIQIINKIQRQDLIIIDDFGLKPLDADCRLMLLEIIEDRHGKKSMIITSQAPIKTWFEIIGDATIADAICDRIMHNANKIDLKGESMRKKKQNKF